MNEESKACSAGETRPRRRPKLDSVECEAIQEYLHGDTKKKELKAAAHYEYARRHLPLTQIAERLRASTRHELEALHESGASWVLGGPWLPIIECSAFPEKPWPALVSEQKEPIIRESGVLGGVTPLRPLDPRIAPEILSWQAMPTVTTRKPTPDGKFKVVELPKSPTPIRYVAFGIDYQESPTELRNRFFAWLKTEPESKDMTDKFKRKGGRAADERVLRKALQDLAWVKIEEAKGSFIKANLWTQKAHRDNAKSGKQRPYFDAGVSCRDAPLYEYPSQSSAARKRADKFASKLFPDAGSERPTPFCDALRKALSAPED